MALAPLYLRGRYVEPLPEYEQAIARVLMAEYLKEQSDRNREEGGGVSAAMGGVGVSRVPVCENPMSLHRVGECRQRATGWMLAAEALLFAPFSCRDKRKEGSKVTST